MEVIKNKITELANSTANEFGVSIVDIELAGSSRKPIVKIFIDKEKGVTLDDCEKFSKAFSVILDVEDPISGSYTLEVSSPGLDRPLKAINDFKRNIGKLVRIVTKESINKQNFFTGRIMDVKNNNIKLSINKKIDIDVPFNKISKARLEIEFK